MVDKTFYWHDYETFGTDPQKDRPAQFAGVRTDEDLNIIDDPLVIYLKPSSDSLPDPDACLITGITPQVAKKKGHCEAEFIGLIHAQVAQPNTCTIGYNNIRFDDEVTRNCLYRNFYDPYAREWQQGNSRWDLIDVVRAAKALRPDGIVWPTTEEGKPTIKLDQLTAANGIAHDSAHDALSDVYATLSLARLIKRVQPKLYQYLYRHRLKQEALKLLKLGSDQPVVHVSGRYSAAKNYLAVVLPLSQHPTNHNGIIVYDLSVDPEPLLDLSADEIRRILFTASDQLPEESVRIPLKTVHVNKSPVLAPITVIRPADAERLELNVKQYLSHIPQLAACHGLSDKIAKVFEASSGTDKYIDPDFAIYSGGFFSDSDKQKMRRIREATPDQLTATSFNFKDSRLPEMLFRYRARNYPETLNSDERQQWQAFCRRRLTDREQGGCFTFNDYFTRLHELKSNENVDRAIILDLENYGKEKMKELGLN